MRKFILTSERFSGTVTFGYNDEFDTLAFYNNESEMTRDQYNYLLRNMPMNGAEMQAFSRLVKGNLVEQPTDLSFDTFWEAYDKKINRKRVEPLFKKLPDDEKLLCMVAVKPYKKHCAQCNRGIADPEKYIRNRYFDTDWRGLK